MPGNQDADTTRATYFAGNAAMVIWSSFLLDELAGLRNDALPTCAQCKDPQFAKNTGILTEIQGPERPKPAAWGEVVSWNVLKDASPKTKELVTYMMSDGYLDWLAIARRERCPLVPAPRLIRRSTQMAGSHSAGVDKKEALTKIYPVEVLNTIVGSSGTSSGGAYRKGRAN